MGKAKLIKKGKHEYICNQCGKLIPVGNVYYKGVLPQRDPIIRCLECGLEHYEVTASNFWLRLGKLQYSIREMYEKLKYDETIFQNITSELNSILEDCQYNLNHLSEQISEENTPHIWQERILALETAICELNVSYTWEDFVAQGYQNIHLRDPDEPFEELVAELVSEMQSLNITKFSDYFNRYRNQDTYLANEWKYEVHELIDPIISYAFGNFVGLL